MHGTNLILMGQRVNSHFVFFFNILSVLSFIVLFLRQFDSRSV